MRPEGEERRQQLVRAAYQRIAEHGFDGLRTRAVAADVGIDHTTLHHYFRTKQDLIAAVVDYATRPFWTTTPAEGTPAERLRGHLAALAQALAEHPERFVVTRELDLRALRDPEVRDIIAVREQGWRESLTTLLADSPDPATGAELIIDVVKGASLNPASATAVLQHLADLLS
jgi:AcrR family transcriptional regulator